MHAYKHIYIHSTYNIFVPFLSLYNLTMMYNTNFYTYTNDRTLQYVAACKDIGSEVSIT